MTTISSGTFGPAFDKRLDSKRVNQQMERIMDFMLSRAIQVFLTLPEICQSLEVKYYPARFPEASISAQLRHLRKPRFGSYLVEKRRRGKGGLWEYRVSANLSTALSHREPAQRTLY